MEAAFLTCGELVILKVFDLVDAKGVEMVGIGDGFVPESEHLDGFEGFDLFG